MEKPTEVMSNLLAAVTSIYTRLYVLVRMDVIEFRHRCRLLLSPKSLKMVLPLHRLPCWLLSHLCRPFQAGRRTLRYQPLQRPQWL